MLKRLLFSAIALAIILSIPISAPSIAAPAQAPPPNAGNRPIICSVMESFNEQKLGVQAIVFHQRSKADGPRLGYLLLKHSGEEMEIEASGGRRYRATVFRVKSCFGRGLALIPTSKMKLGENEEFTLRFP